MYKMYAIANCDTVKKARQLLDQKKIPYEFIDFKKCSPTIEQVIRWEKFFGELPANKKGTTYKKLKDDYESLSNDKKVYFLIENSSMIKRPVLEKNDKTIAIGFDEILYKEL